MRVMVVRGMKQFDTGYYRKELGRLQELASDVESREFKAQQKKVEAIMATMLMQDCTRIFMKGEIIDELESLNDCGARLDNENVQHLLWMLDAYGFERDAKSVREWEWK